MVWPHVRAALVLFHLVAVFLLAFPAPIGGLDRASWKVKTVQEDFEAWARLLHVSEPTLEDNLWKAAQGWMSVRTAVVSPLAPYVRLSGCDQPWRMFVAPVRQAAKLQIQLHRRGAAPDDWETLFEERSEQHRWHEDTFVQERLRTQISRWPWPGYGDPYRQGCAYFSRLAFAERVDAEQVRCRFWTAWSPTPEQARSHTEPLGAWGDVVVHDRLR